MGYYKSSRRPCCEECRLSFLYTSQDTLYGISIKDRGLPRPCVVDCQDTLQLRLAVDLLCLFGLIKNSDLRATGVQLFRSRTIKWARNVEPPENAATGS